MRVLVLGGTSFLSKAVAFEAVQRGHEVVCAARGQSGTVPNDAQLVTVDRNKAGDIRALAGERFDVVIDVATMALRWVREALEALGSKTGHWTFVSSINAYADNATMRQTADAPLLDPITDREPTELADTTPEVYGGVKVASENAVRDLAAWIVTAGEQRISGAYDGVGPTISLDSTLREIADLVAPQHTELVAVSADALTESGVNPWAGLTSLPLWLPTSHYGLVSHDATSAWDAGLQVRPLADTVNAALADERARGLDRPRKAGLTAEEEAALLV